jgi:CubicO group peptidase (beta-lactamase class C family)
MNRSPLENSTVGLEDSMNAVDILMRQAIAENVFPGGVLLVSRGPSVKLHKAYGYGNIFTNRQMTLETVFDLASLTKPLATTLAIGKLVQEGKLNLADTLSAIVPAFKQTDKEGITIRQLLAHHSGLPDYRPYYKKLLGFTPDKRKDGLRQLLLKEPLLHPPDRKTLYSDLGFMILNWVAETVSKRRLDHFLTDEIFTPLGLSDLFFVDLERDRPKKIFAATERCPWRKIVLDGEVHDDNAYVMGGVEGHAGLFGTAREIHRLLAALLVAYHGKNATAVFRQELLQKIFARQEKSDRALGFDLPASMDSSCGKYFPESAVGHLGFTGTSFWMDCEHEIIIILLTNRIHPSRANLSIRSFRPVLHDAVMENILKPPL